jgi:hypothetical protein
MNLEEIKEIIQKEGGKIVIVENDQPQLIIMSFAEYKGRMPVARAAEQSSPDPRGNIQAEPRINAYSPPRVEGIPGPKEEPEGLTIDDLPL